MHTIAHAPRSRADRRASWAALVLLAALIGSALGACSKPGGLLILDPQTPDRDYDVDLGRIPYGETREHVVRMKNAEGRTVSIKSVTAGCTCTRVVLAYTDEKGARVQGPLRWDEAIFALPADATLEVLLQVDSKLVPARNATKRVLVQIVSDSSVDPFKRLEVHTIVDMPFYVVPAIINLGQVPVGGIAQGKTDITQALGTGELIMGVLSKPDNMDVVIETPEELGSMVWRLHVRWFPPIERGAQARSIVLRTSGPNGEGEGRPLEIQVQALGVEDVIAEPILFSVPPQVEANQGVGAVKLRSLVGGNRLLVTGTRIEGPFSDSFRCSATAENADSNGRSEQWFVQLTCVRAPETPGAFAGTVIVTLDDAVTPQVRIPYVRKAQP